MKTRAQKYLPLYRLTNNKTGQTWTIRGWKNLQKETGITSNFTTTQKSKKWSALKIDDGAEWDEVTFRTKRSAAYHQRRRKAGLTQKHENHKSTDYRYDQALRKKFGIGINQFSTLFEQQNGCCYICHTPDTFRTLAVDHDHKTGSVRRLLCSRCNLTLGQVKDDPKILQSMIDYLSQTFVLPEDVPVCPKNQEDKRRWRSIVSTPRGTFSSFECAAKAFNVGNTTVLRWCSDSGREGFTAIKEFASLNEARKKYNLVE